MRSFTDFPFWESRQVVDIGGVANGLRKSGNGRVDRQKMFKGLVKSGERFAESNTKD
jgi:hypothetical protein